MIVARKFELTNEPFVDEAIQAARELYCELLDGLEIVSRSPADDASAVYFVVDDVLIETGHERRSQTAQVSVDEPERLAARCWNAGYTIVVNDAGGGSTGAAIAVLDPFGLRVELKRRGRGLRAESGE